MYASEAISALEKGKAGRGEEGVGGQVVQALLRRGCWSDRLEAAGEQALGSWAEWGRLGQGAVWLEQSWGAGGGWETGACGQGEEEY